MRAAFTLLLLSSPALSRAVVHVPTVRPLPFVATPRFVAPTLAPMAPALTAPSLAPSLLPLTPAISAAQNAPLPLPEGALPPATPTPAEAAASERIEAAAAEVAAEAAAAPAPAQSETDLERERVLAAARFDGAIADMRKPYAPDFVVPEQAHPGWSVRALKDEDSEWLAGVIAALRESRTGRRVLKDIDVMSAKRGRPVLVDVARISNNAEVRYDSGLLVMDKNHRRKPVRLAAPIMAHELQHVLQKAADFIPVDSLEMEVESYTVEARVWNELALKPPPNSFARNAKNRLEKDPDAFFTWLGTQYEKNPLLHGSNVDAYVLWLEGEKAKTLKKIAAVGKRIRSIERVLERMRAAGVPESQYEAHRHDELLPAHATLRDYRLNLAWQERDLRLLSTPEGRERFRNYSRGVIRRARSLRLPEA